MHTGVGLVTHPGYITGVSIEDESVGEGIEVVVDLGGVENNE
jgi:hypothetical protein